MTNQIAPFGLRRLSALFIIPALLTGCSNIPYPTQSDINPTVTENGSLPAVEITNADEARRYIATARDKMMSAKQNNGLIEAGSDLGVAAGAVTALAATTLGWSSHLIIRATIGGGTTYAVGQAIDPRNQELTLISGISALNCVESNAEPAFSWAAAAEQVLPPIAADIVSLQQAVNKAIGDGFTVNNDTVVKNGVAEIDKGQTFIQAHAPLIYQQVRVAVDQIIAATNELLLKDTADPAAFSTLIKGISTTPPSSGPVLPASASTVTTGPSASHGTESSMRAEALTLQQEDEASINGVIERLESDLAVAQASLGSDGTNKGSASFASCVPGAITLVVTPGGPILLSKGQSYEILISGGQFNWSWNGQVPSMINVQPQSSQALLITAPTTAPDKTYQLNFTPIGDGSSTTVSVGPANP